MRGIAGRSLTYNAEDQLLSVGTATYQYDTDGFLSKKTDGAAITTYNYSSAGELLSASLPDGRTLEYIYDPQGRRITKKVNSLVVEKYLWAGLTQLLAVYDGADSLVMRFEYSDARVPNAMVKSGTTYYLSYDQVGSLRAVYDATGALVKRIDYDSFGNILVDTNPAFSLPFGFAGGLDDRDTNLVHFGFRDYDPAIGRWTAKDPIGFNGGDVDLYGYVLNDPVNLVDPTGLIIPGDPDPSDEILIFLALQKFIAQNGPRISQYLGQQGERIANIAKNSQKILIEGRNRIPDVLNKTEKIIGEVKNVCRLPNTKQLQDFLTYAEEKGYDFYLKVRENTQLSAPLQKLVDEGRIILERILPKQ